MTNNDYLSMIHDGIVAETTLAVGFTFDEGETATWIPKSVMRDWDEDACIVAEWFCRKNGLEVFEA